MEKSFGLGKTENPWQGGLSSPPELIDKGLTGSYMQVLSLLQERFPEFEQALRADTSLSDILIGADQRSALNMTDGAAAL